MTVTEAGIVMGSDDREWLEKRLDGYEEKLGKFQEKIENKIDKLPCMEHKAALAALSQKVENGKEYEAARLREKSLSLKWIIAIIAGCSLVSSILVPVLNSLVTGLLNK